ncbi:MAG TPA: hypothetical protein VFV79_05225 [Saprospiraceae bacterium]|nr:hypothetical protein [Saprospiraceae bacterium]
MRLMLNRLILILLCFAPIVAIAQFGVNARYQWSNNPTLDTAQVSQNGMQASLEYHFRLKQKRLEFHPGVGYRTTFNQPDLTGYFNSIDLDFATSIYPFDFAGDCHCPTFSKDGELFKKGFFLEAAPGIGFQAFKRLRSDPDDPANLPIKSKNVVLKLGGAVGLDIGLSDQFTMTPMLSATMLAAEKWEGLRLDGSPSTLDEMIYFGVGMRFTYTSERHR